MITTKEPQRKMFGKVCKQKRHSGVFRSKIRSSTWWGTERGMQKKRNQSSVACESNSETCLSDDGRPGQGDGIQNTTPTTLSEVKNIFTRPPHLRLRRDPSASREASKGQSGRMHNVHGARPEDRAALCLSDCIMRAMDTQLAFQSAAQAAHLERNKFNAGYQCAAGPYEIILMLASIVC